jgi:hypothetical protein
VCAEVPLQAIDALVIDKGPAAVTGAVRAYDVSATTGRRRDRELALADSGRDRDTMCLDAPLGGCPPWSAPMACRLASASLGPSSAEMVQRHPGRRAHRLLNGLPPEPAKDLTWTEFAVRPQRPVRSTVSQLLPTTSER